MSTIEEQLAALAGAWEAERAPVTVDEATAGREPTYVALDVPRLPPRRVVRPRLQVAAVLLVLLGLVGTVAAWSSGRGPATDPGRARHWLPAYVPPGWTLVAAESPMTIPDATSSDSGFVSAGSGGRALSVTVLADSGSPSGGDFAESIDLGDRTAWLMERGNGLAAVEVHTPSFAVRFEAVGLTRNELVTAARTVTVAATGTLPAVTATLPADMTPLEPFSAADIVTTLTYEPSQGPPAMARMVVSERAAQLQTYLATQGGAIRTSRMVDGRSIVATPPATGSLVEVVGFRRVGSAGVGVIYRGDGAQGEEALRLLASLRPVDAAAWQARPIGSSASATPAVPTGGCELPRSGADIVGGATVAIRQSLVVFTPAAAPAAICVSVQESSGAGSSGDLSPDEIGVFVHRPSAEPGSDVSYAYGVVGPPVARVRLALASGRVMDVDTLPVPGSTTRAWATGLKVDDRVVTMEQLDASGAVLKRRGPTG